MHLILRTCFISFYFYYIFIFCFVFVGGMLAYMNLNHCGSDLLASHHIQESYHPDRVYYLSVEEVIWDYAPSDLNLFTGGRLDKNGR